MCFVRGLPLRGGAVVVVGVHVVVVDVDAGQEGAPVANNKP